MLRNNILICLLIVMVVFVSGCDEEEVKEDVLGCLVDYDCYDGGIYDSVPSGCVGGECVLVECVEDYDCNRWNMFSYINHEECVLNECVSFVGDCEIAAVKDYGMTSPSCTYYDTCFCKDWVVDSVGKEVVHENSVEIIDETGHYWNYVRFELKDNLGGK